MAKPQPLAVILGGAGFIGSHLARALLDGGHRLRIFDRPRADLANLEGLTGDWEFLGGDFVNEADLRPALEGAHRVFHLVSTTIPATSSENPVYDVETNLIGTLRCCEILRGTGLERFVFVSSGGTVYGRPETLPVPEDHPTRPLVSYGVVKLAIEHYLHLHHRLHGLPARIVRLSNPYGPRQDPEGAQGAASVFLARAHAGRPIEIWGDGSVVRDFVYVGDAVDGILAAADRGAPDRVYNIGSGTGVSLLDLVERIRGVSGREVVVRHAAPRPFDLPANVLDITRARRELGWEPRVPLEEGLARTWRWLEEGPAR